MTISKDLLKKASEIIFASEGGYSSVNADDNGAVSVGRIQWHGERAHKLLKKIVKALADKAVEYLSEGLKKDILSSSSWARRTVNTLESAELSALLSTEASKKVQDEQTVEDVGAYLEHVSRLGVTEENAQIFMADIENQGGAGASERIILAAEGKDIDSLYVAATKDRVFCNYTPRRERVYQKLVGRPYGEEPYDGVLYEVKAGDVLSRIAAAHNSSVSEIAKLNGISDPNRIYAGQLLKIPGKAPTLAPEPETEAPRIPTPDPTEAHVHTVVRGDTLSALAKKHSTTVAAILAANRDRYRAMTADYIVVGWKLVIPRGETDA